MNQRLSAIFLAASAASLLMVSTAGIAAHKSHKAQHENYKAETNYKAEAPPCPQPLYLRDGFYLGIGVGYDSYRIHQTTDLSETDIEILLLNLLQQPLTVLALLAGWVKYFGYGHFWDTLYLALEINANTSNADSTFSYNDSEGNSVDSHAKARGSYGIALLPGIKLNDSSLLYFRLGYLRTNFKANGDATIVDEDTGVSNHVSASTNKWRNGFQWGPGIQTAIAENVSIRGEFTHTSYNSKTASGSITTDTDVIDFSDKYTLSNNEFVLSAIYTFCL